MEETITSMRKIKVTSFGAYTYCEGCGANSKPLVPSLCKHYSAEHPILIKSFTLTVTEQIEVTNGH